MVERDRSLDIEELGHECGLYLISTQTDHDMSQIALGASHSLQNRGYHASGIFIRDSQGTTVYDNRDFGRVSVAQRELTHSTVSGRTIIGHNRYGTFGGECADNIQPCISTDDLCLRIAVNGNNPHVSLLIPDLTQSGYEVREAHSDTYILTQYLASIIKEHFPDGVTNDYHIDSLLIEFARDERIRESANNMVVNIGDTSYVITDPYEFHPFFMGEFRDGVMFASETTTFDRLDAKVRGRVPRGAVLKVVDGSCKTIDIMDHQKRVHCGLDANYMTDPGGLGPYNNTESIGTQRYDLGQLLGQNLLSKHPGIAQQIAVCADQRNEQGYNIDNETTVVVGVPESSNMMAWGVSQSLNVPLVKALNKKHGAPKTFMNGDHAEIPALVARKFNTDFRHIQGKRVILVDDSVVRGNTFNLLVRTLKEHGASEVYIVSCFPEVRHPCNFGVDISGGDELVANRQGDIVTNLGADGGVFATMEELEQSFHASHGDFCRSCTKGVYPTRLLTPTQ
jgi:amidophosphoribosyltransferase